MGKVIGGLIAIVGIWFAAEMLTKGPSQAFDGLFANFAAGTESEERVVRRTTQERAGDAVERARDEASARRERMLAE